MAQFSGKFICYIPKKFRQDRLELLKVANTIIEEYAQRGVPMSLRQLYYQMVARGIIPNKSEEYNRLGSLINDGRLAGLVSWTAIEDRGRALVGFQTYNGPEAAVRWLIKEQYRTDLWATQPFRPEVWVEKAALENVVGEICRKLRVDFFACRGYNSQSEQWRAGRRLAGYVGKGQRPIVFHLGDHDPSGIDMTRDNRDRLSLFAGSPIQVVRLALNDDQIDQYNPPPNPAKLTDSRATDYVAKYGYESWELDALPPEAIQDLIEDAILRIRDHALWDAALKQEAEDKIVLTEMAQLSNDDLEDGDDVVDADPEA